MRMGNEKEKKERDDLSSNDVKAGRWDRAHSTQVKRMKKKVILKNKLYNYPASPSDRWTTRNENRETRERKTTT